MTKPSNGIDLRSMKRMENRLFTKVELARMRGEADGELGIPPKPRLPPGLRHQAYFEGYRNADPMGHHHGRNY